MPDIYDQQLRQRSRERQNAQNAARNAAAFGQMVSTGQGPLEWDDPIDFGLSFSQVPFVSTGFYIDADDLRDQLELDKDVDPPFPLVTSFVTEWDRDENGLYTGAWVATRVYFPPLLTVVEDTSNLMVDHPFIVTMATNDLEGGYDHEEVTVEYEVPPDMKIEVTHLFRFEAVAIKNVGNAVDI